MVKTKSLDMGTYYLIEEKHQEHLIQPLEIPFHIVGMKILNFINKVIRPHLSYLITH